MMPCATLEFDINHAKNRLLQLLWQHAIVRRPVTLAHGAKSDIYIDCRQIYFLGEAQYLLGELFFTKMLELERDFGPISAQGGLAMGSIPLSMALTHAALRRGRELPGFAVRKEHKEHGLKAVIEGSNVLRHETQVLILEDVVTTASSALKAILAVRNHGVRARHALCIVDRQAQGLENLKSHGVSLYSLFTLSELEARNVDTYDQ